MELTTTEKSKQDGGNGSVTLEVIDNIAIVHFRRGENRLNWALIEKVDDILDQLERNPDIRALITTGENRFYCNGLDLKWFSALYKKAPEKLLEFTNIRLTALVCRMMTFPLPTIAAINGHCYAGGGLLAMCHDYRIMNTEKGWFCMNEVHINIPLSELTRAVLRHKLPNGMPYHEVAVLGRRYTAKEAAKEGIISQVCPQKDLLATSIALANRLTKQRAYNRSALQEMKKVMYEDVLEAGNRVAASKKTGITSQL